MALIKSSLSAALIMAAVPIPAHTAAAPLSFTDTAGHWAGEYISWAVEQHLAQGYADGSFRPNKLVTEAEFLAMLLRAYGLVSDAKAGGDWSQPYYAYADSHGWPLFYDNDGGSFRRGQAALLLASAANGKAYSEQGAIEWLLSERISNGRTSATVGGYEPDGKLTRAEALTFFYNLKLHKDSLSTATIAETGTSLGGVALGDSLQEMTRSLGKPSRIDPSEYGFAWYVYTGGYSNYSMYGVLDNRVTALFSGSSGSWRTSDGVSVGMTLAEAKKRVGTAAKGRTEDDYFAYAAGSEQIALFVDRHDNDKIIGMLRMDASAATSSKPAYSAKLQSAYEQQLFDLANAERSSRGIPALSWDKPASASARKHSADMMKRDFFDHANPDGLSPFARMKNEGIRYSSAAENIAAGYRNAIYAHYGWMNSESGHRESLLSAKYTRLGTGTAFGGSYDTYYTQNFYAP
ncbi:CAP domain-containing protein [Paenibacillus arenilitoris]|uniref:S-layer homology domain-containing protein n=1 Tax=Paenibacillus arenilitoris TaxID=2772299 RepID=A0A927CNW2_9BACL|nr:CAP domain-containing protein [Paenibacillus arenilitoris]MBD2870762.1 S-layer homology domain-containing protein [Paenibacillus arenilitoris]